MAYVAKKERSFKQPGEVILLPQRSEGRLKTYSSATDARCWTDECEERRQYILDIIKTGHQKGMGRYVPIDAIIATLLANKNAEIEALKKKLGKVGGGLTDDKKSQLKEMSQRVEEKREESPRSYAESSARTTDTAGESAPLRSESPPSQRTERMAVAFEQGATCQDDVEILEREIDAMRARNLTADQEAELMQKELQVLRKYCEKLATIQEENERLKQGADSDLFEENNALKRRVEELQNRLKECCNEIAEEKDKVEQLQGEVEQYDCQLGEHAEEKNWLKSRVCQLQEQLKKVEAENNNLKKQAGQVNDIMVHHEEIVRERQCLKAKVCQLQKQLKSATIDIKMEEKLRHHEEVVQERNCLRARICQLETHLVASGKLSEFESYCAQLMEKVQHHEEIVQERNCLRARVCQLEEELKCFQDLPEKLEKYKTRSSVLDEYEGERQGVQERLSQFAELEKEVLELRKSSKKAECLQNALQKCQEELKKVRCCSKNMEMELEQTQCIMETLKAERDRLRDKYESDVPSVDAADIRLLFKERDDLRKRVDELSAIESEFLELLETSRCYETIKAERDTYKAKYDEMVGIELETDYLKDQLEQAKKTLEERDALVAQIRECECCIQDQEEEIKTLVVKVETLSHQQEESEKKIECLREQLIEKNELIKASEEQLKNLQDQLSGTIKDLCGEKSSLKNHITDLEECQNKAQCEVECLQNKLKEKTLMVESLQRKEECCKAAYGKLKQDLEQYMNSCQCAYDNMRALAFKEEEMQNTIDQLQNELQECKKVAEDAKDENKLLIAENAQLKCDMVQKNDELKQLKCDIISKEEAVGNVKSFLVQKDELCRCIFEKLRNKIWFLTQENEKLRKVTKDLADASGDQHLTDLMQKSYATAEKLNEELCRQFNEWDKMRSGADKLELLSKQNKKMKATLKETKLCLLRYQRENEFLRQASEKGGQADEMYLNQLRELNEKILNLEGDNENLRKGIETASQAIDDSCQFLQSQLCEMQQGGICKSSAEVCSKLKDQLEKTQKEKNVVEQLAIRSCMNNEDDLGSICDCTTLRKKLECVKQENRSLKNQIKSLAKQLGNVGNECECQKLKDLLEGRSVRTEGPEASEASEAPEAPKALGAPEAPEALGAQDVDKSRDAVEVSRKDVTIIDSGDPCAELRRQIQDLQRQNQELENAIGGARPGMDDALNAELERLKALLNAKNKAEGDLQAELDRLRALLRDKDSSNDDLKAELDRLRAQLQEKGSAESGLRADLDNLRAELERLRAQLKQKEDELASAKGDLSKCDDLRKELEDLKARLAQAQKERDEATRKLAELQSENNKLKNELQQKLAELQKLQGENSQLKADLQKAKDEAARAQQELSRLQAENSQLKNDLQRAKDEAAAKLAELQQQLSKLQSENDKLKGDLQRAQDEAAKKLAELQKELDRMKSENADLKKAQEEAAKKLADLQSALNNLKAENDKLKSEIQRVQDEAARKIAGLEAELGKLQSENSQLKSDLKRAQDDAAAKLAELQNQISKLQQENGQLKNDLKKAQDDAAAKLAELKNQLEKLQAENGKLKDEIQRVQDEAARKIANLEKELGVLSDQNKQLMKEKADLENEKNNLQKMADDLRGQAANQQELNAMKKERDDLLAQLEALKRELASCLDNMKKAQEACQAELDKARKEKDALQGMLDQMQGKLAEAGQKPVGRSLSELERLLEEERRKNAACEKALADMKGTQGGDSKLDALLDKESKDAAEAMKQLADVKQRLADLEAENQRLLDELEKCRRANKELEDEYNREKARLNELYENALKGQISEDEDALRKELERLRAELASCKKKYEENLGLLKAQHGSQIKEMDRKFSDGVAKIQGSHEEVVKDLSKEHENELECLRKELKKCHDLVCCLRKKIKNLEEKLKKCEDKNVATTGTDAKKECLCMSTVDNVNITALHPCNNKGVGANLKAASLDASCVCGQPSKKSVGCTCKPKKQDVSCICYTEELGVDTMDRGTSKDTDGEGASNIHRCLCGKPFETILFKIITKGIEILTLKELQLVNTEIGCAISKKSGQEKGVEAKLSDKASLPRESIQSQTSLTTAKPRSYAERIKELEEDLQKKQKCAKQKAVALSMAVKIEKEHLDELKKALDIEKQRNKELMERIGVQTKTVTNLQVESDIIKKQNYFSQEKINDLRSAIEEERALCRSLKAELEKERNCSRYLKSMLQSGQGKPSCSCQPKDQDACQGKQGGKSEGRSKKVTCYCHKGDDERGQSRGKDQRSRSTTPKDKR